jgi:hypothetical protein
MSEEVNHPARYNVGKVECIDAIESAVSHCNGFEGFCIGNVIKYLWRFKEKGGVQDLEKAKWYLNKLTSIKPSADNASSESAGTNGETNRDKVIKEIEVNPIEVIPVQIGNVTKRKILCKVLVDDTSKTFRVKGFSGTFYVGDYDYCHGITTILEA